MSRLAVLIVLLVGACSDEDGLELPPLEFESRRARIGVGVWTDHPLYAADLEHLDSRIEYVEARLGVRRDSPVTIYLLEWDDMPCGQEALACYFGEEDEIFTTWQSVDHEIVHAVTREIEFPSQFWSEGAAELLSGNGTRKDTRTVLQPDDIEAESLLTYMTAGHFSRYLVETRGWERFGRVIRGELVEAVYGEPIDALTEAYEAEAPFAYPPLEPCPYPPLPQIDDGVWGEDVEVSQESPEATQFEWISGSSAPGPAVIRSLELEAGTYAVEVRGGTGFIAIGCHTEVLFEEPMPPSSGDLLNEVDQAAGTLFPPIGVHVLEVTAGVYRVSLVAGRVDATAEIMVTQVDWPS